MSAATMNGTSINGYNEEDSDESFVVLSPSLAPDNMETMMSTNLSIMHSLNNTPQTSKELSDAISAMSVSATSELSSVEIHTKLENLLQENLQLKETLHQNNLAMKKQFTTLVTWQEDVMKVHQSHKEKFEETKKLIANLRAENMELKKAMNQESSQPTQNNTAEFEAEKINLKSKIAALEFELDTLRQGYVKNQAEQTLKVEELQTKLTNIEKEKNDIIENLTTQVNSLKTDLLISQEKLSVAQKRIVEMADKIPTISSLETIDLMKKEISELTNDLDYKNQVLAEKCVLVEKLTKENKELETENQTIFIYKTQVEQYQKDFNAEREARNEIHAEKERLAEDLRHLHRRNEELLKQLEQKTDFVHVPSASHVPSHEVKYKFECPKCGFKFSDYNSLENHVYRCIDLDILP